MLVSVDVNGMGISKPLGVPREVPAQICAEAVFTLRATVLEGSVGSVTTVVALPPKSVKV